MERLDKTSATYDTEITAKKTKLMTNNTDDINYDIIVRDQKLQTVNSFKYLRSVVSLEGSRSEILSRIAQQQL